LINFYGNFMNKKLYVGGLPYSFDNSELEKLFSAAGTVVSAKIIIDRDTGRSKGFGFVEMASANEAQQAIKQFNGTNQGGKTITVNEAKPERERTGGRGGYGGGGGGGSRDRW
jgi:RNA recognition motif-containing protein